MQAKQPTAPASRVLSALAAALVILLPAPALAQETATKKAPAKSAPKSRANVMTRDELRACMNEQDRLQQIRSKVEQEQSALDRQKAEVQALDAELQSKSAALDPADEVGKKALEGDVAKRDQVADAYNARVVALREQGQAFDTGRQAWVERCTKKDFDEMDEAAIKKERQQAARKK